MVTVKVAAAVEYRLPRYHAIGINGRQQVWRRVESHTVEDIQVGDVEESGGRVGNTLACSTVITVTTSALRIMKVIKHVGWRGRMVGLARRSALNGHQV